MTDRLEIINHMLEVVGEDSVTSATSNHPTAKAARKVLDRLLKQFQKRGWWFNKDYSVTLSPDSNGHIIIPQNTLRIDPIDLQSYLVQRGSKLYDPVNHTYVIDEAIVVDLVTKLDVDELPESAAAYLTHKCAYEFYLGDDGDPEKAAHLNNLMVQAWSEFRQEEFTAEDINSATRPVVSHLRTGMRQQQQGYNPSWPGGSRR